MFQYLIVFVLLSVGETIECGTGVPILTRIPNIPNAYTVTLQCLCPIDYFGIQCRNHRKISCFLQSKKYEPQFVDTSNFQEEKQLSVIMSAQCYIEDNNKQYISFVDYFVKKNIQKSLLDYELQSGNEGGQIIWANDSSLLNDDGTVKYKEGYKYTLNGKGQKRMSAQDERIILQGNGPYKFTYSSQFLGFPLTSSSFQIVTNIYKILLNQRVLPPQKLQFINYEQYTKAINQSTKKQEEAKQYIDNYSFKDLFNTNKLSIDEIRKQIQSIGSDIGNLSKMQVIPLIKSTFIANLTNQTEFGMLKAEFKLRQIYSGNSRDISINSAVARIPIRVPGIGYAKVYNPNFYKGQSRIIYFILAAIAIGVVYGLYRLYKIYKQKKLKKVQRQVEDQFEAKQFR